MVHVLSMMFPACVCSSAGSKIDPKKAWPRPLRLQINPHAIVNGATFPTHLLRLTGMISVLVYEDKARYNNTINEKSSEWIVSSRHTNNSFLPRYRSLIASRQAFLASHAETAQFRNAKRKMRCDNIPATIEKNQAMTERSKDRSVLHVKNNK